MTALSDDARRKHMQYVHAVPALCSSTKEVEEHNAVGRVTTSAPTKGWTAVCRRVIPADRAPESEPM